MAGFLLAPFQPLAKKEGPNPMFILDLDSQASRGEQLNIRSICWLTFKSASLFFAEADSSRPEVLIPRLAVNQLATLEHLLAESGRALRRLASWLHPPA